MPRTNDNNRFSIILVTLFILSLISAIFYEDAKKLNQNNSEIIEQQNIAEAAEKDKPEGPQHIYDRDELLKYSMQIYCAIESSTANGHDKYWNKSRWEKIQMAIKDAELLIKSIDERKYAIKKTDKLEKEEQPVE